MPIGVVPVCDGDAGGMYQYSAALVTALTELARAGALTDELVAFLDAPDALHLSDDVWDVHPLTLRRSPWIPEGALRELLRRVARRRLPRGHPSEWAVGSHPEIDRQLREAAVRFMVYAAPRTLAVESHVPFVMPVHDLQHRLQPEFPEVSAGGEWERREYLYINAARRAAMLLVDSEVGREDLLDFYSEYGLQEERVSVLPFLPAPYLDVSVAAEDVAAARGQFGLPSDYALYPAQLWPHKNHERLVVAIAEARADGVEIPLVLVGSHSGSLRSTVRRELTARADELNVGDLIRYLGYVPDGVMSALYAGARVLPFPTFFGPTNIPVIEAWAFGCPVVTSDIRGIREQCGDAAILVDPRDPKAIASGLVQAWVDEDRRARLIASGYERLRRYTPQDHRRRVAEVLASVTQDLTN